MTVPVTACFGGTFDPPHLGHLRLAKSVLRHRLADHILFIPALTPPHKPGNSYSSYQQRLQMTRLMTKSIPGISVSEIENTGHPHEKSYTIQTLEKLHALHPHTQIVLLIGADSLQQLHTWHRAAEWAGSQPIITYPRPGAAPDLTSLNIHWSLDIAKKLIASLHTELPENNISSTAIRKAFCEKNPDAIRSFLTPSVFGYIVDHHLYTETK